MQITIIIILVLLLLFGLGGLFLLGVLLFSEINFDDK